MNDLRPVTWRAPATRWRRNPPVGFIRPCEPTLADRPPAGPGWLHEIKYDGFRVLARKQGARVQIWSRRGADFTYRFAAIAEAVRGLNTDEALIDAEAVVVRIDGWSDFAALMTKRGAAQATLVAFDLVRLNWPVFGLDRLFFARFNGCTAPETPGLCFGTSASHLMRSARLGPVCPATAR